MGSLHSVVRSAYPGARVVADYRLHVQGFLVPSTGLRFTAKGAFASDRTQYSLERARAELRTLDDLKGVSGIVPHVALDAGDDGCVFVMPTREPPGSLSSVEFVRLLRDRLATLRAVHAAGYIHGDLGANWLLYSDDAARVDLSDFGNARPRKTRAGADVRSDLYGLLESFHVQGRFFAWGSPEHRALFTDRGPLRLPATEQLLTYGAIERRIDRTEAILRALDTSAQRS